MFVSLLHECDNASPLTLQTSYKRPLRWKRMVACKRGLGSGPLSFLPAVYRGFFISSLANTETAIISRLSVIFLTAEPRRTGVFRKETSARQNLLPETAAPLFSALTKPSFPPPANNSRRSPLPGPAPRAHQSRRFLNTLFHRSPGLR